MTDRMIPFNRPYTTGRETVLMSDAIALGHLSGNGSYTRRACDLIASITGTRDVLLTTSCTHALEMAAILLDVGEDDEVIMPSYTFVSCANAFALRGSRPVFVDIRSDTFCLDESLVEAAITDRTRAIVVVHYAGVGCDMTAIVKIADRHGLALVEDNAHGFGGKYLGQPLGTFGDLATLSFHETKNIQCGEGGALLVNDERLLERAEIVQEKGTNRSRFFRGQIDKYTWVELGSSYVASDLLAAFLTAQLEAFDFIHAQRMHVWQTYDLALRVWADSAGFAMQQIPTEASHPAHLFALLAPDLPTRTRFIDHLDRHGVHAVFHYVPLHNSPAGLRFCRAGSLPVTESVSDRLVRLPVYAGLPEIDLDRVVDAVTRFET